MATKTFQTSALEGSRSPLGATLMRGGANFALYSKNAHKVELLLFNAAEDARPAAVLSLPCKTRNVWHGFVPGVKAGQLYAYRVHGSYEPYRGHRFNPNRVLMDPYARAIHGNFDMHPSKHLGFDPDSPEMDLSFNSQDNVHLRAPRCVVVDDTFDWGDDAAPAIPMADTVIYEMHVRGFTAHPSSGVKHPGTFLGVIEKIPHLQRLGVTSVELLPVHHSQSEPYLLEHGFTNYWGYSTLGYFAPDGRFGTQRTPGAQVTEFKQMVRALHQAGLEVILDVVYNHTCELDVLGPTLCLRGIDNSTYYALTPDLRRTDDYTGCGNTLNFDNLNVIKMVMDSLRYWVQVMHVDGFRFDLATALGRRLTGKDCEEGGRRFTPLASFFATMFQDPVLSGVKLIAEPWDCGHESYQVGNFPVDWAEWNGKYRDSVRKFVKGEGGLLSQIGYCVTGSEDLFGHDGRTPAHSVNFVTAHDGFTLRDLVTYSEKHNEANLQNNQDGENSNNSWNWGVEGETNDAAINLLRTKLVKNYLSILMLSQGIPMLVGGDEFMRTQCGNNNPYCQDNALTHTDWNQAERHSDVLSFVSRLIAFRRVHPQFRYGRFLTGGCHPLSGQPDICWYDENLQPPDWNHPEGRSLAFVLGGVEKTGPGADEVMVILNLSTQPRTFRLPPSSRGLAWVRHFDTARSGGDDSAEHGAGFPLGRQDGYVVAAQSVVVLSREGAV